jgi:hypothetical protein
MMKNMHMAVIPMVNTTLRLVGLSIGQDLAELLRRVCAGSEEH